MHLNYKSPRGGHLNSRLTLQEADEEHLWTVANISSLANISDVEVRFDKTRQPLLIFLLSLTNTIRSQSKQQSDDETSRLV